MLLEQVRCDVNEPFFGLLFKPSDPWSEPVPVILESFWLAARMAHLCIVNRVVSNRWLEYKHDSKSRVLYYGLPTYLGQVLF